VVAGFATAAVVMGNSVGSERQEQPNAPVSQTCGRPTVDNVSDSEEGERMKHFTSYASLNFKPFFKALESEGFPDFSGSPFAKIIFHGCCKNGHDEEGVGLDGFHQALTRLKDARVLLAQTPLRKPAGADVSNQGAELAAAATGNSQIDFADFLSTTSRDDDDIGCYAQELFKEFDCDDDGRLDEAEVMAMYLVLGFIARAHKEAAVSSKGHLTKEEYSKALVYVGFPDVARVMQGQLTDAVFDRMDISGDGTIDLPEFLRSSARLVRPVTWGIRIHNIPGYPGWPVQCFDGTDAGYRLLASQVATLKPGDVILSACSDPLGKYLQFSLDSPWNHAAMVIQRVPLSGQANETTEEILQRCPFRASSHRCCAPGYCRCYDQHEGAYPYSALGCVPGYSSELGLLESTGEGVHIYDLAHRLFEASYMDSSGSLGPHCWRGVCTGIAVRRLLDAKDRDDDAKAMKFVDDVRGKVFSTVKDEFKDSVRKHTTGLGDVEAAVDGRSHDSFFCSKLVYEFYQHMGWVAKDRSSTSVMPLDFTDSPSHLNSTVELLPGQASWGPMEIIWTQGQASLPVKKQKAAKK